MGGQAGHVDVDVDDHVVLPTRVFLVGGCGVLQSSSSSNNNATGDTTTPSFFLRLFSAADMSFRWVSIASFFHYFILCMMEIDGERLKNITNALYQPSKIRDDRHSIA